MRYFWGLDLLRFFSAVLLAETARGKVAARAGA